MKKIFAYFILLVLVWTTASAQSPDDLIRGIWANEENTAHIKFTYNGDKYSAQMVWMAQPNDDDGNPKKDRNNPDKSLQSRPVLGISLIWGLELKDNQWINGSIYSPKKGLTAKCQVEMIDPNTLEIKATKGIFSATKTWKRIK